MTFVSSCSCKGGFKGFKLQVLLNSLISYLHLRFFVQLLVPCEGESENGFVSKAGNPAEGLNK